MGDHQDRGTAVDHFADTGLAFLPEEHVAHAQNLVQDENFRGIPNGRNGKAKTRDHAGGIVAHLFLHETLQLRKLDNRAVFLIDEALGVSDDRAI